MDSWSMKKGGAELVSHEEGFDSSGYRVCNQLDVFVGCEELTFRWAGEVSDL